jgi:hypothetical protein
MRSRWLLNLLLLLAIGVLILITLYEPGIEKTPPAATLTPLPTDEVTRIELVRKTHPPLLLEQVGDDWRIQRDPVLPADTAQVQALTRIADQTSERSYAADQLDLKKLELDPPASRVTLNDLTLDFGALDGLDGLRYVRIGDRVSLIPDLYQHLIDADYTQFVRRRLFAPNRRIRAIELPGLSLVEEQGQWVSAPEQQVSTDRLLEFIEHWENAQALTLRQGEAMDDAEQVRILFRGSDDPVILKIVARDPEFTLARPGWGVHFIMAEPAERFLSIVEPPARASSESGTAAPPD